MDITAKAAYFVADLLLPLIIGYLCRRQQKLGEGFFQQMMTISVQALYPLLAVLGAWATRLTAEFAWLPAFGIIASLIPGFFGFIRVKAKYATSIDQGSYVIAATLSNGLTLGGVSAFILFGEAGFVYTQLITLLVAAFTFLVCFPVAQYYAQSGSGQGTGLTLATVIFNRNQLAVVGLLVGAVLYYYGVPRPTWAGALFDPLVHLAAWMALIPVGHSMDFGEMRRYWRDTLELIPIKFVAAPVLSYLLALPVLADPIALKTVAVVAATPTGILAVITVKMQNLNVHITMAAFIVTTVVYLLLVFPLQFLLFLRLL